MSEEDKESQKIRFPEELIAKLSNHTKCFFIFLLLQKTRAEVITESSEMSFASFSIN